MVLILPDQGYGKVYLNNNETSAFPSEKEVLVGF
jgi:hypothetical protein